MAAYIDPALTVVSRIGELGLTSGPSCVHVVEVIIRSSTDDCKLEGFQFWFGPEGTKTSSHGVFDESLHLFRFEKTREQRTDFVIFIRNGFAVKTFDDSEL